jgi:endonuclease/exonuclease/phosphatase family metal-dependent hydrolase
MYVRADKIRSVEIVAEAAFQSRGEMVCNKGYQSVILQVEGINGRLQIINTHFDSRGRVRIDQFRQVIAALDPSCAHRLVMGDMNIAQQPVWDDGSMYEALRSAFATKAMSDLFGSLDAVSFPQDQACYDHFFLDTAGWAVQSAEMVDARGVSDHCGMHVVMQPLYTESLQTVKSDC